jgi:DNA polymerase
MRPQLHIDFETRSEIDLRTVGLPNYADHPSTDLWCACWIFVDDRGQWDSGEWIRGDETNQIRSLLDENPELFAHNAGFEHALWTKVWGPRWGVPAPDDFSRWHCTAAMAAAMALPRALARAAPAVGLPERKDADGYRLMLQMCRPRSRHPTVWWDQPDKVRRLVDYCHVDVQVEHGLAKLLRPLSVDERQLWLLDHKINQRGIAVDMPAVDQALTIAKHEMERLNGEMQVATGFALKGAQHPASITNWLHAQGVEAANTDKTSLKALLADPELTPEVKRVLSIRDEARRSSLGKLEAFKLRTSADGRLREQLLYHGASTGRWAGAGVQLQNLMRPWIKFSDIDIAFEFLKARDPDLLRTIFDGTALELLANMMRSLLIAEPGHELIFADFSNIEGRVLAWLAGEDWKLDAFRAYDAGVGPDLYVNAVCQMMGLQPSEVDDFLRQIGKVVELSLGFGGGHGAFLLMAQNYGVDIGEVVERVRMDTTAADWSFMEDTYSPDFCYGLDVTDWTALRLVIDGWRQLHPNLCRMDPDNPGLWRQLEDAAHEAIAHPKLPVWVGKLAFIATPSVLWMALPSGRYLSFPAPKIKWVDTPWHQQRLAVTFMGQHPITKQWTRQTSYGGFWSQQATQALARDLLAGAMLEVEARSWPVVLTVHDEIVCEIKVDSLDIEEFVDVVEAAPAWAEGLPLSAKGQRSKRYRK